MLQQAVRNRLVDSGLFGPIILIRASDLFDSRLKTQDSSFSFSYTVAAVECNLDLDLIWYFGMLEIGN